MTITDKKTIKTIQAEFNAKFPYLKIEFYAQEHGQEEGSLDKDKLADTFTIGNARTTMNEGDLSIHANQKVSTLEQHFQEKYGLNVQVFRKSGDVWLQTTTTDNWTLHKQNEKGALADNIIKASV